LFGPGRKYYGRIWYFRDITERKLHEKEKEAMQLKMLMASKLASLGEIATGMAHEINQPLTYLSSFVQGLQMNIEKNEVDEQKLKERLKISYEQIQRISNIIQHLRTFGREDDSEMLPVNINEVFSNALLLLGETIRLNNIDLIKRIEPDLPVFPGNATRLEQVFINLLQNSIDALSDKGEGAAIEVEIRAPEEKKSVLIKVADNGTGIEKTKLDRIFEPFFTTKEVGKGTGLGLSIVYGIVREHGGTITCESEMNRGTTFTITLPVWAHHAG
jgi:two-component system NtrC family sensor kinase